MFRTEVGKDREKLGFTQEVVSAFEFLIKDYGFKCVKIETTFVRYESKSVFINIYHGRGSYEIGFEIGQLENKLGTHYTLGDILDLKELREKSKYTFFQASTKERVKTLVPRLAGLVNKYAIDSLKGDYSIFEHLLQKSQRNVEKYMKEMHLTRVRKKAEETWHKKKYLELIQLYNSIKDDLTPIEAKKLEYAKQKMNGSK